MKMLSKYIVATAVAASVLGSAGIASAQTTTQTNSVGSDQTALAKHRPGENARHEQRVQKLFQRFDPTNTGVITIDAFLKGADTRFDKIDTKHQGFIDKDELTAYFGSRDALLVDLTMKRLDSNGDGKISKEEFEKPLRKRFALLDLNDDGKVTKDEASLAGPVMMPHGHGRPHGRDKSAPTEQ